MMCFNILLTFTAHLLFSDQFIMCELLFILNYNYYHVPFILRNVCSLTVSIFYIRYDSVVHLVVFTMLLIVAVDSF